MDICKKEQLIALLTEYSNELTKECDYNCYNCELGILDGYACYHTCAIDAVIRPIEKELYEALYRQ